MALNRVAADWTTHAVDQPRDLEREWLLTNGTGAYAAGTIVGVNTRRYHGLLVACQRPPVGRIVALTQMLETLSVGTKRHELGTCLFPGGTVAPRGRDLLRRFERGLSVRWHYTTEEGIGLWRELSLHWQQQAATLRYAVSVPDALAGQRVVLRLSPMMTLRDFHAVTHAGDELATQAHGDAVTVRHGGAAVTLRCRGGLFDLRDRAWWRQVHYPVDGRRGQEDREDVFVPGGFELALGPGRHDLALSVALGEEAVEPRPDAVERAEHLTPIVGAIEPFVGADDATMLAIAADDFVVGRTIRGKRLSTIVAGYPWFSDWGRDTFIALPGLLLTTRRHDEARDVLAAFASVIRNGLAPNRFDDYDDAAAHYNTVDGSMWFVHAALEYIDASGDYKAWDAWLGEACRQIIEAYLHGTEYGIRCTGDGLITAGDAGTQLTWMDAACDVPGRGRVVFTPRQGKAVEINALWYSNLLGLAQRVREEDRAAASHYEKLASRARRAFGKVFFSDSLGYCVDHVWSDGSGTDHADASLRPNQIFAVSLPRSPLPLTRQKKVVAAVASKLLTPMGLRTLSPDHAEYRGRYAGPPWQRDGAYHQGTVWPWLIGPYAEAVLRVGRFSDAARAQARAALRPLIEFMRHPGVGQLYEIHEGDAPHSPRGCFAQAWSVAEVLRVAALAR